MPKMTVRVILKSGVEFSIKCDKFTLTRNGFQQVTGYNIEGITENKPVYLDFEQVAAVVRAFADEKLETDDAPEEKRLFTETPMKCPFCEGENSNARVYEDKQNKEYFVYCQKCGKSLHRGQNEKGYRKRGGGRMNAALLSSKNMCWCTPQDFFDRLNAEFGFVLDPAATDKTAKCSLYYTPETDGLSQSWDRGGAVFCNPPYGREIGKWVQKAFEEARGGYPIVLLIPARTDTAYFHDYIYGKAEIRFVRGRLRFTDDDGNAADPAPFPSMVVIYNGERVKE